MDVIGDRVDHSSELLILLLRPDIQISQKNYVELFVNVITEILRHLDSKFSLFRVLNFFFLIILNFGFNSSLFGLIPPNNRHNNAPVDTIPDTKAYGVEQNKHISWSTKSATEEFTCSLSLRSVVDFHIVIWRSQDPFVRVHENNHS